MFSAFDISTSGLMAQRARLDAIASNIANVSTLTNEAGENDPYRKRYVTFAADTGLTTSAGGIGVKVEHVGQDSEALAMRYEPEHPLADAGGYVAYPDIDMTTEFVDALEATRAYEANVGVMEISKDLGRQTLQIIA